MAITLQQFSNFPPGSTKISFYVDTGYTVKAINISTTACDGVNTFDALAVITSVTATIEGISFTFPILNRELKGGYYFFTVEDTVVSTLTAPVSASNTVDCDLVTFIPSVGNISFETSDYNAIISNATEPRLNTFIFDVDRQKTLLQPTNFDNIIAGTALKASVPDSNYTSAGLIRGKYIGTETSVLDYGIESSLSLTSFDSAVYGTDVETGYICSQSLSDRTINTLGFVKSDGLPSIINSYPDMGTRTLTTFRDGEIESLDVGVLYARLDSDQTVVTVKFRSSRELTVGDVLAVTATENSVQSYTLFEFIQVSKITKAVKVDSTFVRYDIEVLRGLAGTSKTILSSTANLPLYIFKIKADTIYTFENNKPVKLTNRQIYIPSTQDILYVGSTGKVIYLKESCTV